MKEKLFLFVWKTFAILWVGILTACDGNDKITEQDALTKINQTRILLEKDSISDNDSILNSAIKYFAECENNERLAECYYLQGEIFNRNRFYSCI